MSSENDQNRTIKVVLDSLKDSFERDVVILKSQKRIELSDADLRLLNAVFKNAVDSAFDKLVKQLVKKDA